jgi:hypothetical protein
MDLMLRAWIRCPEHGFDAMEHGFDAWSLDLMLGAWI